MDKFEKILINHFGCTSPVFDANTGGLTTAGKEAFQKLKNLVNELDSLKVIQKSEVIKALRQIVETHVLVSQLENISPELNQLRMAVVGKSLFTYDSWNSSSMTIIVDGIEIMDKSILFTGNNNWGNRAGIYVNKECLEELLATGCATKHETIDRCDVQITWKLQSKTK